MYMGQPAVYSPTPGSMPPADLQSYQNPGYTVPSAQSLPPTTDNQQTHYPEKALL